jgi:iron complex outermembrane receptor protein
MARNAVVLPLYFCALCSARPAYAQNLVSPPSVLANPAPASPGEATAGVSEIVITARKRSEAAQRVPITVSVLTSNTLAREQVKDLFQAVTLVPGVVFSRAPDDGLALTFRGLGTAARPTAFEQSIALFTDGVFLGKTRLYSTTLFDLDRIEFIKGTQSTMLGKNASLGAINLISRPPGDKLSFEGRAGYELVDGGYQLEQASDLPLNDNVSLRVAAHYNDLNGWVHNDVTGHTGPEHKDLGLRATMRARLTDRFTVTGSYQYSDNRQIGASYQLVGGDLPSIYGDDRLNGHPSSQQHVQPAPGGVPVGAFDHGRCLGRHRDSRQTLGHRHRWQERHGCNLGGFCQSIRRSSFFSLLR